MSLNKILPILILLIFSNYVSADALPKGYMHFKFETKFRIDSIMILESDEIAFKNTDTIKSHWTQNYAQCKNNQCTFIGHTYKKFQKLVMFSNGKNFTSDAYETEGNNPKFIVINNGNRYKIKETTNFLFRGITGSILRALIITVLLELFVAFLFFRKKEQRIMLKIIFINCISLPFAWLTFSYTIYSFNNGWALIVILEILIIIFEFFALKKLLKAADKITLLNYTLTANVISFFIGGFLYIISLFI